MEILVSKMEIHTPSVGKVQICPLNIQERRYLYQMVCPYWV